MFALVNFGNNMNENLDVFPATKMRRITNSEVIISTNRGRYRAQLLCTNNSEQVLKLIVEDIKCKRLKVALEVSKLSPRETPFLETSSEPCIPETSELPCIPDRLEPQIQDDLFNPIIDGDSMEVVLEVPEPSVRKTLFSETSEPSVQDDDFDSVNPIIDNDVPKVALEILNPPSRRTLFPVTSEPYIQDDDFDSFTIVDHDASVESAVAEYKIIEKTYDKKESESILSNPGNQQSKGADRTLQKVLEFSQDDSDSDWIPDEYLEQEQWDALLETTIAPPILQSSAVSIYDTAESDGNHVSETEVDKDKSDTNHTLAPTITYIRGQPTDIIIEDYGTMQYFKETVILGSTSRSPVTDAKKPGEGNSTSNDISLCATTSSSPENIPAEICDVLTDSMQNSGETTDLDIASPSSPTDGPRSKKMRKAKKHCCVFCSKFIVNLPRHLRTVHPQEEEVKSAVERSKQFLQDAENKNLKRRSHPAFEELRKHGDYRNNQNNPQNMIMVRNSPKPNETRFVSCVLCKGFYSIKCFKHHFRNCNMKLEKKEVLGNISNTIGAARVNGQTVNKKASPELIQYFFPYFTKPEQAKILFNDDIAVEYGNKLMRKYYRTNAGGKHHIHISSQLRLLADIFINCRIVNPQLKDIRELINPKQYDNIVKAIHLRCGYNNGVYKSPTTASNCCTLLLKVTRFLKCEAIKNIDSVSEKLYSNFEYLLANSQNHDITRQAQDNKMLFQRQKREFLPTTAEVNNLLQVLENEMKRAYEEAVASFNQDTYSMLAKATLAYLIAFNRKRPGDVEKTQVLEIKGMMTVDPDNFLKLSKNDQKTAEEFSRYITQGKLNKKASNLIPKPASKGISLLIEKRNEIGIPSHNQYIFAIPTSGRLPYFKGDDALRFFCQRNQLNYSRLNANKLRKHLATSTAMLPSETQNVVSDFMGHTMAVHKNVYQQKEAHTDIVVMGKILMEASGLTDKSARDGYEVQNLTENSAEDACEVQNLTEKSAEDACEVQNLTEKSVGDASEAQKMPTIFEETYDCGTPGRVKPNTTSTKGKSKRRVMKTMSRPKRPWKTPEKLKIRKLFQRHLNELLVPSIQEVQEVLQSESSSVHRNATVVRSWIHAEMDRIKKNRKGIPVQRWTTPQRHKVRNYFKPHFDLYKRTMTKTYPTNQELETAVETIPEFRGKNSSLLRSKIQHEFSIIHKTLQADLERETSESSDTS